MKILTRLKHLLTLSTRQDDDIIIYADTLKMVIKHNDVGVSVDYYRRGQQTPFREEQVWFTD